jgi:hypothetical protein
MFFASLVEALAVFAIHEMMVPCAASVGESSRRGPSYIVRAAANRFGVGEGKRSDDEGDEGLRREHLVGKSVV